jgi:hypothetical protein
MFYWLGTINIILAVFNMLPAFPLDGGRVFRATAWGLSKNYLRATRWASYVSQGFAYLAILVGVVSLFSVRLMAGSGLWMILLGWFLLSSAKGHLESAQVRESLRGVPIGQLVQRGSPLDADWPLIYAADLLAMRGPTNSAPVVKEGRTVGFLTLDGLRSIPRIGWGGVSVERAMTPVAGAPTVDAYRDLYDTLRDQELQREPYLVVTANHQPIGILSQRELLAFAERFARGY